MGIHRSFKLKHLTCRYRSFNLLIFDSYVKRKRTTDRNHSFEHYANLVMNLAIVRPEQVWVADISVPQQQSEKWEKASRSRLTGADCKPS